MTNEIRPELPAKEAGAEVAVEEEKACFDQLHWSGELSDEELANVSGGFLKEYAPCPLCGGEAHKAQREK